MTARSLSVTHLLQFAALGRPLHLVGGVLFYALGIAIARYGGVPIDWQVALGGQLVVTAIQLMTHYSNEYFDLEADRANQTPTRWSGGSRVLVGGAIAPGVALRAAVGFALVACLAALALMLRSPAPWQTALLVGLAMGLAWSYSAPPLLLNQRALGELTGGVLVPGLTALVGFQLQAGALAPLPLLAIVPLCCFQFAMLLVVNFPDAAGDTAAGKITLVVRLGGARAARLYLAAIIAPYAALPLLAAAGLPWPVPALLLVGAPIALWLAWRVQRGAWADPRAWDSLGFWSIGLLMTTALMEFVGFLVLIR